MTDRAAQAAELMARHAKRGKRYLWTDAFAVCNYLALGRTEDAVALVERVHHTLGRHRSDDKRKGWISGLGDADGELNPTLGGIRIGKLLPERGADDRFDDQLEWDRDGQYFHYLTKWMHALDRMTRATKEPKYLCWARELADTAFRKFSVGKRMYWKMSIDLSRPLVASMGHHDPLDGYVTYVALDATAKELKIEARGPDLANAIAGFAAMIDRDGLATADPLGLGGLLVDAHRVAELKFDDKLLVALLKAAITGLEAYRAQTDLHQPASRRLAFRELGLAIGLAAVEPLGLDRFERYLPMRTAIESFWLDPKHRKSTTWLDHEDINDVMLATALVPEGFLVLTPAV